MTARSFIFIVSFILTILYAPADTEERPLVSKKLRRDLKIKSLVVLIIFYITILFVKNNVYANLITFSVLEASLLLTPIVYKLFGRKYANYKNI
jgi:accessory gene regulator B